MPTASTFSIKKLDILRKLGPNESNYIDKSPKGAVDEQIVELIQEINSVDGLVTTSSCSGRISVFLEASERMRQASKIPSTEDAGKQRDARKEAGRWLFSSHSPIKTEQESARNENLLSMFCLKSLGRGVQMDHAHSECKSTVYCRYIYLKFEPMILHIATASLDDAQKVLCAALDAGFRESGAINFNANADGTITPLVAVRSSALASDTVIGYQDSSGNLLSLVDESYLQQLVDVANDRFRANSEKKGKFRSALLNRYDSAKHAKTPSNEWEDPVVRKERKRTEGLKRQLERRERRSTQLVQHETGLAKTDEDIPFHGLDMLEKQ